MCAVFLYARDIWVIGGESKTNIAAVTHTTLYPHPFHTLTAFMLLPPRQVRGREREMA